MSIPFTCPHCGTHTNVDDQYAGQTGPCTSCGQTISVPGISPGHGRYSPPQRSSAGPAIAIVLGAGLLVLLICGGISTALYIPARQGAREAARRAMCTNNLKQLGVAMHNYHDTHGCFPTAVLTDDDGLPMRSWRVAIMPWMESGPTYELYDFSEPWDGPSNQALLGARSSMFVCPSDPLAGSTDTSYMMIMGEGTIGGEPNEFAKVADVKDGLSNTILAIEIAGSGIAWLEPSDMTVDEAVAYISNPAATGQTHVHPGGVNALFADGSVHFISSAIDTQLLENLLTRDDGQAVGEF